MSKQVDALDMEPLDDNAQDRGLKLIVNTSTDTGLHPHDVFISKVVKRLSQWTQPDWLDVGCGWHFDWPWELEREKALLCAANVVGLDSDRQAIARHRTIRNRTVGTIERLPFASRSFDIVTASVVLEHLKYPALAFAEIFRVLKCGGCFIFRTPSARSYFVRVARWLPQNLKVWLATGIIQTRNPEDVYPAHYRVNTSETIQEICKIVGFRRIEITVTKFRGILGKVPALARVERIGASVLGMTEGNLVVEALK